MRYQSKARIGELPVLAIAFGPDLEAQQARGYAVGVVAIGDMAVGIIAIGGLAVGVLALGGMSAGIICLGGLAFGVVALGGLAIGGVALGGLAVGYRSLGGLAIGVHPQGGLAFHGPSVIWVASRHCPMLESLKLPFRIRILTARNEGNRNHSCCRTGDAYGSRAQC